MTVSADKKQRGTQMSDWVPVFMVECEAIDRYVLWRMSEDNRRGTCTASVWMLSAIHSDATGYLGEIDFDVPIWLSAPDISWFQFRIGQMVLNYPHMLKVGN